MSPFVFKIAGTIIPPIAAVLCRPAGYGRVGRIESRNKISTIETVEFANTLLGKDLSVAEMVRKIGETDRFRALWLGEGLGLHFGIRALARGGQPRNFLIEGEGTVIPPYLMLMVHAGIALAFARHNLDAIGKNPQQQQIFDATRKTADLIVANGISGYSGISYEAWGMVTQFFYRKLFLRVIQSMEAIDPEHVPHMWHGAGRACYFQNFMPRWKDPWPAFPYIQKLGPAPVPRANLLAGLASATVIVNMKTPEVLEAVIRERISRLPAQDAAAYAQGIACSVIMREDTTPGDERSRALLAHKPPSDIADLWQRTIVSPARMALENLYPMLSAQRRLDEVTCYRPLESLKPAI